LVDLYRFLEAVFMVKVTKLAYFPEIVILDKEKPALLKK
jgi:hypothetical protein